MAKMINSLGKVRQALFRILGMAEPGNDSILLVSFPKSGRTWLRVMLDAAKLDMDCTHDSSGHRGQRHFSEMEHDKSAYRNRRVVLLVRDPRDVVVSSYFHATKRLGVYSGTISEFIRDPKHGIEKIILFNSEWFSAASIPREFFMIQYEDMHERLREVLTQVIRFADASRPLPDLDKIIELGRFENMKEKEGSGELARKYGGILKPGDVSDPESFKCRKGKVGGYDEYLCGEDIAYCEEVLQNYHYMELLNETAARYGIH